MFWDEPSGYDGKRRMRPGGRETSGTYVFERSEKSAFLNTGEKISSAGKVLGMTMPNAFNELWVCAYSEIRAQV
jgi:hypothetical protein